MREGHGRSAPGDECSATDGLCRYQLDGEPIFVIGALDAGVTVLSQQIRALNLVWALVQSKRVNTGDTHPRFRIAVVGGGLAGLTAAAAMLKKNVNADITIFERRDTAVPLQQGCDTRWIHPRIYDWPSPGSEAFSAALPVLNWTASRASDVVVQVLREWKSVVQRYEADQKPNRKNRRRLRFFCNTRHLQITSVSPQGGLQIEWVGEPRDVSDPSVPSYDYRPGGALEKFDLAILAVGFGVEQVQTSYWRNEELAQPHLGQATMTYIVSGAGDSAMIDLFRIRIAQFRQDRILSELFENRSDLLKQLRKIEQRAKENSSSKPESVFNLLDELWKSDKGGMASEVTKDLTNRLRRDTRAILHIRRACFSDLFEKRRISFQNRMLAFLLYTAGGFSPSSEDIETIAAENDVPPERIIRRHGLAIGGTLKSVLAQDLHPFIDSAISQGQMLRQDDQPKWAGGYFDFPGTRQEVERNDRVRAHWRKEYLPGPTQAIATAFCSALAGYLRFSHPSDKRLRVTLHRTLLLGAETVLQQCCEYQGIQLGGEPRASAGRTFPAHNGTIGAAFATAKIVRSKADATLQELERAMEILSLNNTSREMSKDVQAFAAIPLVGFSGGDGRAAPSGAHSRHDYVIGVVYIDSYEANYFADVNRLNELSSMTQEFMSTLCELSDTIAGSLANNVFWAGAPKIAKPSHSLNQLPGLDFGGTNAARFPSAPYINLDYSDFTRVESL
ncbi:NAD(P)-binding protein [Nonomuraea aurantiaca]|uniref:NAD(P)-binding protein n=1 Tax=Nonomuraea aurantiaca TaxID=2878562 RepID=UPI001CD94E50|nr:NAD(P)-binding protein [Nonomuraea aurantiaca]MCA2230188.1 FAD-dependent oxidoreductase [Nonomuraea aurantiaca]